MPGVRETTVKGIGGIRKILTGKILSKMSLRKQNVVFKLFPIILSSYNSAWSLKSNKIISQKPCTRGGVWSNLVDGVQKLRTRPPTCYAQCRYDKTRHLYTYSTDTDRPLLDKYQTRPCPSPLINPNVPLILNAIYVKPRAPAHKNVKNGAINITDRMKYLDSLQTAPWFNVSFML